MSSNLYKSAVLISLFALVIAATGTLSWCRVIGGCTLGKYEGKITFTNLTERSPIEGTVGYYINNGDFLFINSGEYLTAETDSLGSADIDFTRAFYSPLFVTLSQSNERKAEFRIYSRDIKVGTTISRTISEDYVSGGTEDDIIELELEVESWSLF